MRSDFIWRKYERNRGETSKHQILEKKLSTIPWRINFISFYFYFILFYLYIASLVLFLEYSKIPFKKIQKIVFPRCPSASAFVVPTEVLYSYVSIESRPQLIAILCYSQLIPVSYLDSRKTLNAILVKRLPMTAGSDAGCESRNNFAYA